MRRAGLVLAPEVVRWNVSAIATSEEPPLEFVQRRACFTEISEDLLSEHSKIFGPISLAFTVQKLREAGAVPVAYAPQGMPDKVASYLSTFLVRGAYYTRAVLETLQSLQNMRQELLKEHPSIAPGCEVTLTNTFPPGNVAQEKKIPIENIEAVLDYALFRNIPLDHSIGVLNMFQNMFYPTDNEHTDDLLGYYRQREWRLIGSDVAFHGHPLCRSLEANEVSALKAIDKKFWEKTLTFREEKSKRCDLASLYQGQQGWSFIGACDHVVAPKFLHNEISQIISKDIAIREYR